MVIMVQSLLSTKKCYTLHFFNIVGRYVSASYTSDQCTVASLLSECLLLREGALKLPVCFCTVTLGIL